MPPVKSPPARERSSQGLTHMPALISQARWMEPAPCFLSCKCMPHFSQQLLWSVVLIGEPSLSEPIREHLTSNPFTFSLLSNGTGGSHLKAVSRNPNFCPCKAGTLPGRARDLPSPKRWSKSKRGPAWYITQNHCPWNFL